MLAEAQRICFERAERPSVVNGDRVLLRIKDAFSPSEADSQFSASQQKSPVCVRFAHLDWGYEKFSLSEAGGTSSAFCKSHRGCMVCYLWITKMIYMQRPSATPRLYSMLPLDN